MTRAAVLALVLLAPVARGDDPAAARLRRAKAALALAAARPPQPPAVVEGQRLVPVPERMPDPSYADVELAVRGGRTLTVYAGVAPPDPLPKDAVALRRHPWPKNAVYLCWPERGQPLCKELPAMPPPAPPAPPVGWFSLARPALTGVTAAPCRT